MDTRAPWSILDSHFGSRYKPLLCLDASAMDAGYTAQQLKSARSLPHANRGHEMRSSITTTETHQGHALLPTRPKRHPRRPASLPAAGSRGAL